MSDPDATIERALQLHQAGDLVRAAALYREILQVDPANPEVLHLLGGLALQLGRYDVAARCIQGVLRQRPYDAEAHSNLGNAFQRLGRLEEAADCHRNALRLAPGLAEAHSNLGDVLKQLSRLEEAADCYREALRRKPDFAGAHNDLGLVLHELGHIDEAIASYRLALQHRPDFVEPSNNLGNAYLKLGRLEEAIACFRQALQLRPELADLHLNLAVALQSLGRTDEAADCCRHALALRPVSAEIHNNLGNILKRQRKLEEATLCYRRALELRPDFAGARYNLGTTLKDQGEVGEAIALYRETLALAPGFVEAHTSLVFCSLYDPKNDSAALLREARLWNERHAQPLAPSRPNHENEPDPNRRLRVGYVSPDFRDHPIANILLPLLANHDRGLVEVHCYAGVANPDHVTDRLRGQADVWRGTAGISDEQLAQRVRDDRIDVLVDLNQHLGGCRLLAFARRPAPVQVTWLGYPGTTGLSAIGYRLTDPHLDPPGETDADYSERSIRLPDTFWCYDPMSEGDFECNALPALAGAPFTFGSLNNFCKVNADLLARWASVLRAVPGSRLLLLAPVGRARDRVLAQMEGNEVDRERIAFVDLQPRQEYLRTYHRIDVCLDPLPYNGHNTSLDAAWMGVPTVTLVGKTIVGRAGWSLLRNLGLPELAARSDDAYVAIAKGLADDLPRLAQLRAGLRVRMAISPLMDGPRFARGVEAAYREMWRDWCHGR
jgi:predicted O-linked N-acetylglucosamine transferase (SPINDLY family)